MLEFHIVRKIGLLKKVDALKIEASLSLPEIVFAYRFTQKSISVLRMQDHLQQFCVIGTQIDEKEIL